jgi:hypothetical protein
MAQGYTRQSTFADGDTITASLFNNEYNQLENTLFYSSTNETITGHRHDGTAGQGGNIFKIGDLDFLNKIEVDSVNNRWGVYVEVGGVATEQVRVQDGSIVPVTTNDIDLGTGSLQFKDLFIDGTASIDSLTLSSGSTVTVILDEDDLVTNSDTALATQQSIKSYVDAQITAQDFDFSADSGGALSIDLDSESMTFTGGTGIDTSGAGNVVTFSIDSTVATLAGSETFTNKTLTNPDINGGTIDGTNITVGLGTTLDVSGGTLTLADNQISGDKVEGGTIAATTITDLTFGSLNDGSINITAFVDEDTMSSNSATLVPTQQSVKAYVDSQVTGSVVSKDYGSSTSPIVFTVTVASKTSAHPYNGDGFGSAYFLNGIESPALSLLGVDNITSSSGYYYKFDQSDASNSGHPLRLYYDAAKTSAYTTNVTTSGTPGSAGAHTTIAVTSDTPNILYYQCSSHDYMGNHATAITATIGTTGALKLPVGTTAQRPTASAGQFRYNSTTGEFEGYTTEWGGIGGGAADLLLNTFTGNGSDVAFTLSGASIENNTLVYVDGVYQNKSTYTVSAATPAIVTFSEAPANGSAIEIMVAAISVTDIGTPSDNTVTTVKIVDGAVTTAKLADSNVTTAKLADTSVTTAKIADDAVGADQLAPNAVVTDSIVDDAVTAAKIASEPITVGITSVVTATSLTATVNTHVYVSAATQTITLPASPTIGQRVLITVGNFTDTVVGRNGSNIMSSATDLTMDAAYLSIQFIYTDATQGWVMS